MTDIAVTLDTKPCLSPIGAVDLADEHRVTGYTIRLGDLSVAGADTDWVGKVAGSKCQTMIPAVDALDHPFAEKAVWGMTAIAGGDSLVA